MAMVLSVVIAQIRKVNGEITRIVPATVITTRPPRKPINTGKICPPARQWRRRLAPTHHPQYVPVKPEQALPAASEARPLKDQISTQSGPELSQACAGRWLLLFYDCHRPEYRNPCP